MVIDRLAASGADFAVFNQRQFDDCEMEFVVTRGLISGQLRIRGRIYPLASIQSVFSRMMDDRYLPELEGERSESPRRRQCRALHEALTRWTEIAPQHVVNRPGAMATNISKPYQSQLIRDGGFLIPETLVTNDPELVREFHQRHRKVIYKSISAARSIVQTLNESDFERLQQIRWCPTQFQAFIEGTNLRVHVVGDQVFATAVETEATDYRYAAQQTGKDAQLREVELSDELSERCIRLTRSLGLVFAGIDLKVTPSHEVFCFEVNPSPAFSYYESHTAQPISAAVAYSLMHPDSTG
jgi:glutathione synthase/RimK-type ligase-like ATP-grasp enzyme